jgi:hypothetical protein
METSTLRTVQLLMATGMFCLGFATFVTGVAILVARTWGRDLRTLTAQTTRLAHKGLAEEVSGLVGNASALLSTINDMVHTTTGIGVFLTTTGLIMMGITYWLVVQIA